MARYLISEAARQTGVEAHVLRFWEEELMLEIPRNELGHRYYTEEHIAIFRQIQQMKEQGFQLKAIKDSLARSTRESAAAVAAEPAQKNAGQTAEIARRENASSAESLERISAENIGGELSHADKLVEFESIVYDIVAEALRNNNERLGKEVSDRVNDKVVKEMNYLMRENEEYQEEHFRKLDEALTRRGRKTKTKEDKEAAATKVVKMPVVSQSKRKHRLFARKRKTTIY